MKFLLKNNICYVSVKKFLSVKHLLFSYLSYQEGETKLERNKDNFFGKRFFYKNHQKSLVISNLVIGISLFFFYKLMCHRNGQIDKLGKINKITGLQHV